ncbi:MAG: VOC family protein [Firmicutes bacterium]|nr:VOC family protein [Bacillota bacterium]
MNCKIASLYICVKDMERAVRFYEEFFGQPVTEKDSVYSVFDINGFRFGLFAYQKMKEDHTFGSNCLPSVGVPDVQVLRAKLEGKEICFPLTRIKDNWVAEFVDSEGNHIEITAPVG